MCKFDLFTLIDNLTHNLNPYVNLIAYTIIFRDRVAGFPIRMISCNIVSQPTSPLTDSREDFGLWSTPYLLISYKYRSTDIKRLSCAYHVSARYMLHTSHDIIVNWHLLICKLLAVP